MRIVVLFGMLSGCPWISPGEHAENLAQYATETEPTTGLGTSVTQTSVTTTTPTPPTTPTTPTTTTTPTSTTPTTTTTSTTPTTPTVPTTPTPWECGRDAWEPNNEVYETPFFSEEDMPLELPLTLCEAESLLYPDEMSGLRYDWFGVDMEDTNQALVVQVRDGLNTTCAEQDMGLLAFRPNGQFLYAHAPPGLCPMLRYGHGEMAEVMPYNLMLAYTYESAPDMDYNLSIEAITCPDSDGDGALDMACGGFDCEPFNPEVHPLAFEVWGSGVDENCDGIFVGRDCLASEPSSSPYEGSVPCMAPRMWMTSYDIFRFDVIEGSCVEIRTDILQENGPLLLLEVQGVTGNLRTSSRLFFADTEMCSHEDWTGSTYDCPSVRFVAEETGSVFVAVGQQSMGIEPASPPMPGACPLVGDYQLSVVLDGFLSVPPILVDDDVLRSLGESPF